MTRSFTEPLESRVLMAATPTRFDVTIAKHRMTIVASGESAFVSYHGNSIGGGGMEEEYHITDASLTVRGLLYVNGRRQPLDSGGQTTTLKLPYVNFLDRISYRGTIGTDEVAFDNLDAHFSGTFDVALGGGADRAYFNTNDFSPARAIAVSGGAGDDRIEIEGRGPTDVSVFGGAGRDKIYLNGAGQYGGVRRFTLDDPSGPTYLAVRDVLFKGGVRVTTDGSADSLLIERSVFTRNTVIRLNTGDDTVTSVDNRIPTAAVIDLGDDD